MPNVTETAEGHNPSGRSKRKYDSSRRSQQAAATRRRIVSAAADCFAELGYARTTMALIGERAGVSTESVLANGPKRALLIAAFSQAFVGEETDHALKSDPFGPVLAIEDRDEFVRGAVDAIIEGQRSGIGMWRAVQAGAIDEPELAEPYAALAGRRRADILGLARLLAARGWLADDRPIEQVADTLALLVGFEPYQLLVLDFGWSEDRLRAWTTDMLERVVLRPRP
jgi:AcrR family transcriptional regulator